MAAILPPSKLTKEFLVLGEGDRDVALVTGLVANRTIRTSLQADYVGGQDGFQERLTGYSGGTGWDKLKGVLLISDNDASSNKSFKKIKDQLNAGGFSSPPRPLEIARKTDMPPLAVLMLPYPSVNGSSEGCLETLTIPALETADAESFGHVRDLLTACEVASWPKKGSRDKLTVRCNISVRWPDDPMLGFQFAFGKGLIPLDHEIFNEIVNILSNLRPWFDSG
jgi:hypothetical protein